MDVFSPPATKPGDRHPVVMFIHGGAGSASRPKDWGLYKSWGRTVAASGFTAVTFNHRLGYPDPLLEESATDVAAAIDYVRAHAREWNADGDRICLAAFSAGGPMLTLGFDKKRPYVRCLIGFYAFMDIQQTDLHSKYEPAERVRAFSPIEHLGDEYARSVPMFIGRGGLDEIPTMNDSIDRYIARAIEKNANIVVWNHPTGTHTFDNQNDDDRSREIIAAALEFMRRHLNPREGASYVPAGTFLGPPCLLHQHVDAETVVHPLAPPAIYRGTFLPAAVSSRRAAVCSRARRCRWLRHSVSRT